MLNLETFQAAPGSYNISQDISTRSQVLNNAPRAAIPRGKKNPSVFISNELAKEFQGADSPPVSKYSPDATLLFKSSSMPKFGGEQRKDHFLIARDRSPGPIYLYSDRNKRACSFGVGGKALGPGLNLQTDRFYDTKVVDKRVPIRMKGYISEKVYMKNMEGLNKGKLGPGPGAYENSAVVSKGGKLPKAVRLQPCK